MAYEYSHMDEVLPNLWVGDLVSAQDAETLQEKNIHSVLTAMRGRVSIQETFLKFQINLDDTEDADILQHLLPSIAFIQAELDKNRGVLVHCQAGMSRSATIVAAYLMYSQHLDVDGALEAIRKVRPSAHPNDGFMRQLEIFHQAAFKVSRRDKATRMFYLERAVDEILNGDGSAPETDMFARFPRTPSDSAPPTPGGPRRRIRCKHCRTELASREHMLDHGQLGPPTPAVAFSPITSRRPSINDPRHISRRPSTTVSRRPSAGASVPAPRSRLGSGSGSDSRPRRPSLLAFEGSGVFGGLAASLSMSALETEDDVDGDGTKADAGEGKEKDAPVQRRTSARSRKGSGTDRPRVRRPSGSEGMASLGGLASALSMSALDSEDEDVVLPKPKSASAELQSSSRPPPAPSASSAAAGTIPEGTAIASPNGTQQAPSASSPPVPSTTSPEAMAIDSPKSGPSTKGPSGGLPPSAFQHPSDLAAQLYANPKLAALRSPVPLGMSPIIPSARDKASISPPILANPKCSGYFVEPMKWMDFFLEEGQLAGKILCPNKKCSAKLGNYDWAGVCCSCKEWVVPGFCIHRSKVDEIV
ncbi:hypothetical protein DENSPDRAFT_800964 [Dentipellis sp. KUC8613]|nr:hypothetical protein DENSPDRAFT_800964 [Dentipellis sp. KUC8613]